MHAESLVAILGRAATPPALEVWGVPILVALITGVVATLLTGWLQQRREDRAAKREGIRALWNMHRCLQDLALVYEDLELKEGAHFSGATRDELIEARKLAYEHLGVLRPDDRHLVRRAELVGMIPMEDSDDLWDWSKKLEVAISRVDPNSRRG